MTEVNDLIFDPQGGAYGETSCGGEDCEERAVVHVRITAPGIPLGDVETTMACLEHREFVVSRSNVIDWHDFGPVCNMPGAHWYATDEGVPGTCRWAVDDETYELDTLS